MTFNDNKAFNVEQLNQLFFELSAEEMLVWVMQQAKKPFLSTSFGPDSAVLLHMATQVNPDVQVVWVDSGYNTNSTYRFALNLIGQLDLNIKIYTPQVTSAFLNVKNSGIPDLSTTEHKEFTDTIKLEPFNRALNDLQPDVWLTGVRAEETQFRQSLAPASWAQDSILKIAPLLNWTQDQINDYLEKHRLPSENNYFDPTKVLEGRECGLHTRI